MICYVDGFNLYFGLRTAGLKSLLWLDLQALAQSLLVPGQELVATKYFTSRIAGPDQKRKRQEAYLDALQAKSGGSMRIEYGKYITDTRQCRQCGVRDSVPSEKMTDVNIAVALLSDAYQDHYESALLITADSDLVPAVRAVRTLFPDKRVCVAFPPARHSNDLRDASHASFTIGRAKLAQAQMPRAFAGPDGRQHECPSKWMPSGHD